MVKLEPSLRESPQASATINRILVAAEKLFAEHGIAGTSVRNITEAAQVNVAAVNYHFESKAKLVHQVMERRASILDDRRDRALDDVEARARIQGRDPKPIELVEAMVRPLVELALSKEDGWDHFIRFVTRLPWESGFETIEVPASQIRIFQRFDQLLRRALPQLEDDATRTWRMTFMRATTQQTLMMITTYRAGKMPKSLPLPPAVTEASLEDITRELAAYILGGLSAPKA